MVSCRNGLTYLEPEPQQKLLSVFALNPGGCLFLGSADGVGTLDELFVPIPKRRRIFRRLGQAVQRCVDFAATDAGTSATLVRGLESVK
jgi:two-component system CheB/CheR fusion protein